MDIRELVESRYCWPDTCPDVLEEWHGWCDQHSRDIIQWICEPVRHDSTALFVELGAWLGLMTRHFLDYSAGYVISIDTWQGSPEHVGDPHLQTLEATWRRNLWPWRDRVIGLRCTTMIGLRQIRQWEIPVAGVWIDACHSAAEVAADLAVALHSWPEARIGGHDYQDEHVHTSIHEIAAYYGRELIQHGTSWRLDDATRASFDRV